MNPAALMANLGDLPAGATIIVDTDDFTARNLTKAGYAANPLEDDSLGAYLVHRVDLDRHDGRGGQGRSASPARTPAAPRTCSRSGLVSWMYGRPIETTVDFLSRRFAKVPDIRDANITALQGRAGTSARPPRRSRCSYEIKPATMPPGTYRNITGNLALAYGLIAAGVQSGLPVFLGSYPITPASDVLHELSKHKSFGVTTFQAEDEIAGIGAALGASFAGHLGVTTTSGPGIALKSETIGLAVMTELPLVIIDVQRGGPSTGLPTKTEQADLLQAMFGRNGEAPVPIVAPRSPGDCFDAAVEAARIAITYRTPVILLSDGYLANGSEPWRIPELDELPTIDPAFATAANHGHGDPDGDRRTSGPTSATRPRSRARGRSRARPGSSTASAGWRRPTATATSPTTPPTTTSWCAPARPRSTGSPTRCPRCRSTTRPASGEGKAKVLVLGWGSTYGPIGAGVRRVRQGRLRRRPGPPAPPQPVPRRPRRRAAALRQGARPRDEPRPAGHAAAGEVPRRRRSATTGSRACRSRPASSPRRSASWSPRPRASSST